MCCGHIHQSTTPCSPASRAPSRSRACTRFGGGPHAFQDTAKGGDMQLLRPPRRGREHAPRDRPERSHHLPEGEARGLVQGRPGAYSVGAGNVCTYIHMADRIAAQYEKRFSVPLRCAHASCRPRFLRETAPPTTPPVRRWRNTRTKEHNDAGRTEQNAVSMPGAKRNYA